MDVLAAIATSWETTNSYQSKMALEVNQKFKRRKLMKEMKKIHENAKS